MPTSFDLSGTLVTAPRPEDAAVEAVGGDAILPDRTGLSEVPREPEGGACS